MSIKYGQNNDRTTASTWSSSVRSGSRNRTEIGVDRALTLTSATDPGAGVEVRTNFLRQRKIAGTMEIPQLCGQASETTLSHVHPHSFLYPFSSEYSFMTKYRKKSSFFFFFLQIYIKIWHLCSTAKCQQKRLSSWSITMKSRVQSLLQPWFFLLD